MLQSSSGLIGGAHRPAQDRAVQETITLLSKGREVTCRNPIYRRESKAISMPDGVVEVLPATITAETSIDEIDAAPLVRTPRGDYSVAPRLLVVSRRLILDGKNIPKIAEALGLA
jgi:hypothetical protein